MFLCFRVFVFLRIIGYIPESTDATNVEINRKRLLNDSNISKLTENGRKVLDYCIDSRVNHKESWLRSIFGAFHHLRPEQVQLVIYDTIKNGDGLIVAEKMLERNFIDLVKWPLLMTLSVPLKWLFNINYIYKSFGQTKSKLLNLVKDILFVTLIQPFCLIVFMHDACVSAARSYTFTECKEMVGNGLHRVAIEKGFEQGSDSYFKFVQSYEFRAWTQPTLAPQPWGNLVKLTCFSLLPLKEPKNNKKLN